MGVIGTARRTFIRTGIHKSPRAAVRRAAPRAAFLAALFLVLAFTPFRAEAQQSLGGSCPTAGWIALGAGTSHPGYLLYCNGSTWGLAEAFTSGGLIGIGTTSPGALLDIGSAGHTLGTMRLEGNTSGYVQVQSAAAAGSWTMTLPASTGTSGYVLQTDGTGVTSWVAAGSGATITLGTSASATNPQRTSEAGTGFYSATDQTVAVAANGVEAMQWNTVTSGNTYVNITPGASAAPTIGVGGSSSGLILNAGSGALTLETTGSNGAIDITPNGTGPVVITSGVTSGTGSTAGLEFVANSLTTGNGEDIDSSSLTTGNLVNLANTNAASTGNVILVTTNSTDTTGSATGVAAQITGAGNTAAGIIGKNSGSSNGGWAILGNNSGSGNSGVGVLGENTSSTNTGFGGFFTNNSTDTTGNATGVFAQITGAGNTAAGVLGKNSGSSNSGWAIIGENTGSTNTGYAGYFENTGGGAVSNYGVYAKTNATGAGVGVYATELGASNTGYAAQIVNSSSTGWGVYASGTSPNYFAGNVGIGTTAPNYKLEASGGTANPSLTAISGTMAIELGANGNQLVFGTYSASPYGDWIQAKDNQSGGGGSGVSYPLSLNPLGGNVGIGTASPDSTLSVNGGVAIGTTYAGTNAAGSNNLLVQGEVGIGTTSPAEKLTVTGTNDIDSIRINNAANTDSVGIGYNDRGSHTNGISIFSVTGGGPELFTVWENGEAVVGRTYATSNDSNGSNADGMIVQGNVGIGTASPVDSFSIGTAINASATHALFNLSNTALSSGSGNGTYIGANPASFSGNFIDFQVNGSRAFSVSAGGDMQIADAASFLDTGHTDIVLNSVGSKSGTIQNDASNTWSLGYNTGGDPLGTAVLSWNASGNVGIANASPGALLDIGSAGATLGTLRLEGSTSGYLGLQPSAAPGSVTWTLPSGNGSSGQALTTNGAGTLSWATITGTAGNPAGSSGQIQFNGSSAFAASANLVWDNTNYRLGIGTSSPSSQLSIVGSGTQQILINSTSSNNALIDYQSNSASEYYEGYSAGTGDWAIIDSTGTYELMALTGNNHLQFHGTAPTISTCGTSPSVVGNDNAFTITVGTGTTTACTATFASAWTNVPQCNVTPNYSATVYVSAASTTAITITMSANGASKKLYVNCRGYN